MLLNIAYIGLFGFWLASYFVILPVPLNLITTAVCIIVIASSRSLKLTPYLADQVVDTGVDADGNAISIPSKRETLSAKDAYMFPVIGSCSLFGLYCAFKYLDPAWVQFLLSGYFSLAGVFTLTATFVGALKAFPNSVTNRIVLNYKFTIALFGFTDDVHLFITIAECVSFIPAVVLTYYYILTKHYMLNNVIGIAFCIQGIENISVGSVKTATVLLVGLFFYDIFWVFGTDVMVSVAKNVKGPLLLMFPRVFADAVAETKGEFSMLGLGDIVIPGLFVALLYRLDTMKYINQLLKDNVHYQSIAAGKSAEEQNTSCVSVTMPTITTIQQCRYSKAYFHVVLVSYAIGLMMTVGVMYFFNAAQPALLYLVPCTLLASGGVALANKEFSTVYWPYTEEEPEAAAVKDGENKDRATSMTTAEEKKEQ